MAIKFVAADSESKLSGSTSLEYRKRFILIYRLRRLRGVQKV